MGRLTTFARRLFGATTKQGKPFAYGRDVGLSGTAADVPLYNQWQIAKLEQAGPKRDRLDKVYGYYMTVEVNARHVAEEFGDLEAERLVDSANEDIANYVILRMSGLQHAMADRGYADRLSTVDR